MFVLSAVGKCQQVLAKLGVKITSYLRFIVLSSALPLLFSENNEYFFYEDGLDNLYNERGEKVYDPMEGILTDVNDLNIVLENITSREKYLSAKRPEEMLEEFSAKKQPRSKKSRQASSYKNYSDFTRETFIDRMLEQPVERCVVSGVAKDLSINYRTALRWRHL